MLFGFRVDGRERFARRNQCGCLAVGIIKCCRVERHVISAISTLRLLGIEMND